MYNVHVNDCMVLLSYCNSVRGSWLICCIQALYFQLVAICYCNSELESFWQFLWDRPPMMTMLTMLFWFLLYIKVNPTYVSQIEEKGMKFVARDVEGERMEIMEIPG